MRSKIQSPLFFLLIMAALIITTACSPQTLPAGTEVDGKILRISLEENLTTGYSWSYEASDGALLELIGDAFITSTTESEIIGKGGMHIFEFQGSKAGETTLTFNYFRSWEGTETSIDTRVYKITVDAYGTIKSVE